MRFKCLWLRMSTILLEWQWVENMGMYIFGSLLIPIVDIDMVRDGLLIYNGTNVRTCEWSEVDNSFTFSHPATFIYSSTVWKWINHFVICTVIYNESLAATEN